MEYKILAARTPSTPPKTLLMLTKENTYIRQLVAANPSTPPEALKKLSKAKDNHILQAVAQHLNTPPTTLVRLTKNFNQHISTAATQNPSFIAHLHHRAVQDGICEAGQQVPVEWLQQMYLVQ